jgi:hypothetical protein
MPYANSGAEIGNSRALTARLFRNSIARQPEQVRRRDGNIASLFGYFCQ